MVIEESGGKPNLRNSDALGQALERLGDRHELSEGEMVAAVRSILEGAAAEARIAAFLTALHVKGETDTELVSAVRAVRDQMTGFEVERDCRPLLDTCGTGGDGARTINISTATALVVAACGIRVVKHGNRSASGNSGSAEVLAELGVAIDAPIPTLQRCLKELGITFLYAPQFHPALKEAAAARRQLPFRTLFNLVGPLANPAQPEFQLVGVPYGRQAKLMARALCRLGTVRSVVVTGSDGLDEVTLGGTTRVLWVEHGGIRQRSWRPEDLDLPWTSAADLRVQGPGESAARLRGMLAGEPGPVRHAVLANAATALLVVGRAGHLAEGIALAEEAIDSGAAARLLEDWARLSAGLL
jgi:anthranilate phosphoribosyltransferase